MILAVFNEKGGAGKTTTAVNLAVTRAKTRRVVLLDLDPQRNASGCFFAQSQPSDNIVHVLFGLKPLSAVAVPCFAGLPNFFAVDGNSALRADYPGFQGRSNCEMLLAKALVNERKKFDDIIIDCPGDWGLMVKNALLACSHHLLPVGAGDASIENGMDALESAAQLYEDFDRKAPKFGVLMADVFPHAAARKTEENARALWGKAVFRSNTRHHTDIRAMMDNKKTVFQVKAGTGREDFQALTEEMYQLKWL